MVAALASMIMAILKKSMIMDLLFISAYSSFFHIRGGIIFGFVKKTTFSTPGPNILFLHFLTERILIIDGCAGFVWAFEHLFPPY